MQTRNRIARAFEQKTSDGRIKDGTKNIQSINSLPKSGAPMLPGAAHVNIYELSPSQSVYPQAGNELSTENPGLSTDLAVDNLWITWLIAADGGRA
ncbi:MAG: hypothetical protein NTZ50_04255 [Chloroflexi bacterium]|nr:hypothetical protein [Chloroflexota bacterium]